MEETVKKFELDTPALMLDIDQFNRNLEVMRDRAARAGKKLRPHAKTHKCPEIARRQIAAGNCAGICAAKVSEAAGLADAGIADILITSPVTTPEKIARLMKLHAALPGLMQTIDNHENAAALSKAALRTGKPLPVLVDLDPEMGRTGIRFADAPEFGRRIAELPGLKLMGIQCYCGHLQHIADFQERKSRSQSYMNAAARIVREFRAAGLNCEIFTGTGTGTSDADLAVPELTDIQVGSYCMMDAEYAAVTGPDGRPLDCLYPPALTMLASVVSANHNGYVTLDAGTKALYLTPAAPPRVIRDGKVLPGWTYDWFGDEHGRLSFPGGEKPRPGSKLELVVSHCDPTVNLFDEIFILRNGEVIDVWKIALRGCCR